METSISTLRDEKEEIGIREREGHLSPCPDDLTQLPSQSGQRPPQHDHCNRPMTEEWIHPERDEKEEIGIRKERAHPILFLDVSPQFQVFLHLSQVASAAGEMNIDPL
jgi:hypothetical protein